MFGLLSLLFAFVGVLVYYYHHETKRVREKLTRFAEEAYDAHVRRLELPPSWIEVTDTLSRYLANNTKKHLLFENPQTFNAAASAALEDEAVREDTIAALRVRLGHSVSEGGAPTSTASLKEGTKVFVRKPRSRRVSRAVVMTPNPHHLLVELAPPAPRYPSGTELEILYRNERGIFRIITSVLGQEDNELSLRHTEKVSREQKRKFFRTRVSEPARVCRDAEESEVHTTRVLDLGGGGAGFTNPEAEFQVGDLLRIDLTARDGARLSLHAKVLRLSEDGNVCHVEFYSIRESVRDKIYNLIFSPPQRQQQQQQQ